MQTDENYGWPPPEDDEDDQPPPPSGPSPEDDEDDQPQPPSEPSPEDFTDDQPPPPSGPSPEDDQPPPPSEPSPEDFTVDQPPPPSEPSPEDDQPPPPSEPSPEDNEDDQPPPPSEPSPEDDQPPPPSEPSPDDEDNQPPPPSGPSPEDDQPPPPSELSPEDFEDDQPPPPSEPSPEDDQPPPPSESSPDDEDDQPPPPSEPSPEENQLAPKSPEASQPDAVNPADEPMWQPAPPPEEAPSERKVRMMQHERDRIARRKRRRKKKKKILEHKKKQLYKQSLRKEMLERHLHQVQEIILNPPKPTSKHAEEEPLDADLDPQFYHPSTFGYHNPRMFREKYDSSVLSPVFFEYPVDHRRARGSLEPAWKRQLNKQQPRPCRVEARHPAMIAYTMHSQTNWNSSIWSPVFHGMKFDSSRTGIEREGPINISEEDSSFAVGDTGIVISPALLQRMRVQQEKRKALRRRAKVMAVLNKNEKSKVSATDSPGDERAGKSKAGESKASEGTPLTAAEAAAAQKHKDGNRFRLRKFMWETRDRMEPCFFCEGAGPAAGCPRCSHRESGPKKRQVYSFVDTRENVRKLMADGRGKDKVKHIRDVGAALRRMRQKKMQENKAMVTVYVKKVPSGEVVTLRLDVRSTLQYLYFMYRSNSGVEGLAPNMHLFLPVSTGIFYLNYSLEPATELRTEWCPGFFTLADLHITRGETSVCIVSFHTKRRAQARSVISHYLVRNLVDSLNVEINSEIKFYLDDLPALVPNPQDQIQASMLEVFLKMIESKKRNKRWMEQRKLEQVTRQAVLDLKTRIQNSQRYKEAAARKAAMKLIGHRAQTARPRRKRRHRSRNAHTAGGMGFGLGNTLGSLRELDNRAITPPFPSPGSTSKVAFGKAQPMPASVFGGTIKSPTVRLPRL